MVTSKKILTKLCQVGCIYGVDRYALARLTGVGQRKVLLDVVGFGPAWLCLVW